MRTGTKEEIRTEVNRYLFEHQEVIFTYLFGSFVQKDTFRDIDIGIYVNPYPDMIHFGMMQSELDDLLESKVDLILLNDIFAKDPVFGHQVITNGELLFCRDTHLHVEYKSKVFRRYFDTVYLREMMAQAFTQRLESEKFGMRNYE